MKCLTTVKLDQVGVSLNIAQNHPPSLYEVISAHFSPIHMKA